MISIDALTGAAILVTFPLLMLVLLMVIAPNGVDLDELVKRPTEGGWPRGVQEEEPVRWRLDLLSPRIEAPGTGRPEPAVRPNAPAHS
jgi:hypothetical protein